MKHVIALLMLLWAIGMCCAIVFMDLSEWGSLGFGCCAMVIGYWVFTMYDDSSKQDSNE